MWWLRHDEKEFTMPDVNDHTQPAKSHLNNSSQNTHTHQQTYVQTHIHTHRYTDRDPRIHTHHKPTYINTQSHNTQYLIPMDENRFVTLIWDIILKLNCNTSYKFYSHNFIILSLNIQTKPRSSTTKRKWWKEIKESQNRWYQSLIFVSSGEHNQQRR